MSVLTPTRSTVVGPRYKWLVLSNTTIGVLLATINATSLMIALPVIFRGIHLNPLQASNFPYLLWIMMGYMLVSAAVVVTVGPIGDMFGRVKMYNLGFAWFTVGAILLSLVWSTGSSGALELVILRMFQAIGGALLMANSAAIITDAFPSEQLGFALGMNMVVGILGSFLGILVGGLLSQVGWRWVFLANVPVGVFGTVWAYMKLKEIGVRIKAKIDWLGNLSFAAGLAMILTGATYGIKPYGHSLTGWGNPFVLEMMFGGLACLVVFVVVEMRVDEPMFRLSLFRIRAFTAGNAASFLGSVGRGGFQFMLMIWFQGIWLPQHGYSFTRTPLWAGIYMIPFMVGFVVSGPISGRLSDRYGARPFATAGMLLSGAMYAVMMTFPANFSYWPFAAVMFVSGIGGGLFFAEHGLDHELGPCPLPRGGFGDAGYVRPVRDAALDGALLHSARHRAELQGACGDVQGPSRSRGPRRQRCPALPRAAPRLHLRRLLGLEPAEEPPRPCGAQPSRSRPGSRHHRPGVLSPPHRPPVQGCPDAHPRFRRGHERDRSDRLGA